MKLLVQNVLPHVVIHANSYIQSNSEVIDHSCLGATYLVTIMSNTLQKYILEVNIVLVLPFINNYCPNLSVIQCVMFNVQTMS